MKKKMSSPYQAPKVRIKLCVAEGGSGTHGHVEERGYPFNCLFNVLSLSSGLFFFFFFLPQREKKKNRKVNLTIHFKLLKAPLQDLLC
jgi:hypothetical protein